MGRGESAAPSRPILPPSQSADCVSVALAEPGQQAQSPLLAESLVIVPSTKGQLDLLTVTSMPSNALSDLLVAHGCTYSQLRKRGMDLWYTQTVTMDADLRTPALEILELQLRSSSISCCVSIFRQALTGHELLLFDRFLYVLLVSEPSDCDDRACVGVAMRCLEHEQHARGTKRKYCSSLQQDGACNGSPGMDGGDPLAPKRLRASVPSLEDLVVMLGLAGVTATQILDAGVSLYCETPRRPNTMAQKYAAKHIQDCTPRPTSRDLLRLFYYLLGDEVYSLLCADLQAITATRPRASTACSPTVDTGVPALVAAFREVVERHARNYTAFERRHRVRQLEAAVDQADVTALADVFYAHLEPNEVDGWNQALHTLDREDLWRAL